MIRAAARVLLPNRRLKRLVMRSVSNQADSRVRLASEAPTKLTRPEKNNHAAAGTGTAVTLLVQAPAVEFHPES